eukprot:m.10925 g.10925  ORF g.10925 m.10925 type:complete len:444 (+) comp6765_c0_seq1:134-1465(+)
MLRCCSCNDQQGCSGRCFLHFLGCHENVCADGETLLHTSMRSIELFAQIETTKLTNPRIILFAIHGFFESLHRLLHQRALPLLIPNKDDSRRLILRDGICTLQSLLKTVSTSNSPAPHDKDDVIYSLVATYQEYKDIMMKGETSTPTNLTAAHHLHGFREEDHGCEKVSVKRSDPKSKRPQDESSLFAHPLVEQVCSSLLSLMGHVAHVSTEMVSTLVCILYTMFFYGSGSLSTSRRRAVNKLFLQRVHAISCILRIIQTMDGKSFAIEEVDVSILLYLLTQHQVQTAQYDPFEVEDHTDTSNVSMPHFSTAKSLVQCESCLYITKEECKGIIHIFTGRLEKYCCGPPSSISLAVAKRCLQILINCHMVPLFSRYRGDKKTATGCKGDSSAAIKHIMLEPLQKCLRMLHQMPQTNHFPLLDIRPYIHTLQRKMEHSTAEAMWL